MKSSSIVISSALHISLVILTALSLPFLSKKPIDLPPIVSVELIQIAEETSIPFAPKAKKIIEKVKEKEKKLVSEQAPPCLLYTSPSPRDISGSRMPSSA